MPVDSDPAASQLGFCPQCGRLMADEQGPLCDRCAPAPVSDAVHQGGTPVTWLLVLITAVASAIGLAFTHEQFPPGSIFGPDLAGGEWWRLVTAIFVHLSLGHFLWNMIPLGFFGLRLERILGHWTFLAFYLACGVSGSVASVYLTPEIPGAGASGAVFGVCAGLFVYYATRLRTLSHVQKTRLAALGIYTASAFWRGLFDAHVDNGSHLGGLAAGIVLGVLLCGRAGSTAVRRSGLFLAAGLLLVAAGCSFRPSHRYLVHIDAASRAIKRGQKDLASSELRIALAMKPDSRLGHFLEEKIEQQAQPAQSDSQ